MCSKRVSSTCVVCARRKYTAFDQLFFSATKRSTIKYVCSSNRQNTSFLKSGYNNTRNVIGQLFYTTMIL